MVSSGLAKAQSSSSTCVIYNTKDRVDLAQRSFPALAAKGDFDLIWMDGSRTEGGLRVGAVTVRPYDRRT